MSENHLAPDLGRLLLLGGDCGGRGKDFGERPSGGNSVDAVLGRGIDSFHGHPAHLPEHRLADDLARGQCPKNPAVLGDLRRDSRRLRLLLLHEHTDDWNDLRR